MNDILVRHAQTIDIEGLLALSAELAEFHGDRLHLTAEFLQRDIFCDKPQCVVLVAEKQGRLVGCAAGHPTYVFQNGERCFELQNLCVSKDFQGKSIGRMLTEAFIAHAAQQGATSVKLGVMNWNTGARDFYAALGFKENQSKDIVRCVFRIKGFYGEGGPP